LFLRDRAAALYDLVGDPPAGAQLGSQDTDENYAEMATKQLKFRVSAGSGGAEVGSALRKTVGQYADAQVALRRGKSPREQEAVLRAAVLRLAILCQELTDATVSRCVSGDREAPAATAMSAAFVETMRGVLDIPARGPGRLANPVDRLLLSFGATEAQDVKTEIEQRDDPTDPGRFGESPAMAAATG